MLAILVYAALLKDTLISRFVYVIAWPRWQLRINFTSIFNGFHDEGNLENFENTSEINP